MIVFLKPHSDSHKLQGISFSHGGGKKKKNLGLLGVEKNVRSCKWNLKAQKTVIGSFASGGLQLFDLGTSAVAILYVITSYQEVLALTAKGNN